LRSVKIGIEVYTLAFLLEKNDSVQKGSYTLREIYAMFYTFFSKNLKYPINLKKAHSFGASQHGQCFNEMHFINIAKDTKEAFIFESINVVPRNLRHVEFLNLCLLFLHLRCS